MGTFDDQRPGTPSTRTDHGGRSVLLVEDDEDIALLIRDVLCARGHTLYAERQGAGALARLRAVDIDMILLDLSLPDMSGDDFLDERARVPRFAEIPVVILSGAEDAAALAESRKVSVLRKPFRALDLLRVVEADAR
jgi:CheY-like chemotaxis protein